MNLRRIHRETLLLGSVALALAGCHRAAPGGQVLASVGGKDITLQDVRAEGRADGVPAGAGQQADIALLQRVVDRELLAQSAHAQKLDQTPNSPSDLARVEQVWRADKAAKKLLVGMAPPTDSEAQRFIADHPYAFAKRERINAKTITIAASPTLLNQLKTYTNYDAALAFLKHLGVAMSTGDGQLDTAQLPAVVAQKVAATPDGTLLILQPPGRIQLAQIEGHTPIAGMPENQLLQAKQDLAAASASQRISAELVRLKVSTPVTYQAGYAPPNRTPPLPAAGPNTTSDASGPGARPTS